MGMIRVPPWIFCASYSIVLSLGNIELRLCYVCFWSAIFLLWSIFFCFSNVKIRFNAYVHTGNSPLLSGTPPPDATADPNKPHMSESDSATSPSHLESREPQGRQTPLALTDSDDSEMENEGMWVIGGEGLRCHVNIQVYRLSWTVFGHHVAFEISFSDRCWSFSAIQKPSVAWT